MSRSRSGNGGAGNGVAGNGAGDYRDALNIYDAVAQNRRRTNLLIVAFVLLVGGVTGIMGLLLGFDAIGSSVFVGIGVGLAVFVALWVYRSSDKIVLSISSAREVQRSEYPELVRTVENMAIASGVPMPKVYLIDDGAPNAFATGRDPQHGSVAITTGLLEKLDRLELEAVMAHELSHIRNMDTRLMVVTAVLVGFIALLADVMLRLTWFGAGHRRRYSNQGGGPAAVIILLLAIVAMVLAPIVAKAIQLAISRQREYLADASAALLTRYPEGLASALEKLEADKEPLEVANKATEHLYIVNPMKGNESALNNMFRTHPPIEERVGRLRAMMGRMG